MTLLAALIKINEVTEPLPDDMPLEQMVQELEKRFAAARRGMSLTHRLTNASQKKRHFAAMLTNMNKIRAQLNRAIKKMEEEAQQFARAETDYEGTNDVDQPTI